MGKQRICIVAFSDTEGRSLAYRKFSQNEIDAAVDFYRKQLMRESVSVISTRKTIIKKRAVASKVK